MIILRKLLWALLMPVIVLSGLCHLLILAMVDFPLMILCFMVRDDRPVFNLTRSVFRESLAYYVDIFRGQVSYE